MPGFLYHVGAQAQCPHLGQATTVSKNVRVMVSGMAVATLADTTTVAACPFATPEPKPSPCVTVKWTVAATRVQINGQPALLSTSTGVCQNPLQVPQGPPLITVTQTRVSAM